MHTYILLNMQVVGHRNSGELLFRHVSKAVYEKENITIL